MVFLYIFLLFNLSTLLSHPVSSNQYSPPPVKAKNVNLQRAMPVIHGSQYGTTLGHLEKIKPGVIQGLPHKIKELNKQQVHGMPTRYHAQLPPGHRHHKHKVHEVHVNHGSIHGMKPAIHGMKPAIHGMNPAIHGANPAIHGMKPANQHYKISDIPLFKMEAVIPSYNMQVGIPHIGYQPFNPLMVNSISELHPSVEKQSIPKFIPLSPADPMCSYYPWLCGEQPVDMCQLYPSFCEALQADNFCHLYPQFCQSLPPQSSIPDQHLPSNFVWPQYMW